MRMKPEIKVLPDGRECTIRSAGIRDAERMCEHERITAQETDFILLTPAETEKNRRAMAQRLSLRAAAGDRITLCAFVGDELAGTATVSPYGELMRVAHRCTMSIALKRKYWGSGIADALMEYVTDFGQKIGYRSIELSVDAANLRAIALYERFGFRRCGSIEGGLRHSDGSLSDEVTMFRLLE